MSRIIGLLALAAVLAVAFMGVALAADWPQWRGINRDGVSMETGLLKAWPAGGPPLLWKMEGLGLGYSTVAVVGKAAYTMGDKPDGEYVLALDLANQKILWSTKVGGAWKGSPGPGAHCTPTVDGDMLYVTTPGGDVAALTTAGKPVWSKNFKTDFGGDIMSGWGYSESPLVDGDKVIVTPGNKALIVALNKKTGETLWKSEAGEKAAYASCVISEGGGVRQYITNAQKGLVSVDAKTGKVLWRNGKATKGTAHVPTPVVRGDYVFGSNGYGAGAVLLKLSGDGAGGVKADEVKFLDGNTFQNHHGGMVLVGDYLYAGSGHNAGQPACVNFKTGELVWKQSKAPGSGSAGIAAADGCIYLRYESGEMVLIAAAPDGYKEIGKFKPPVVHSPAWSHPVIADGKLYLRDQETLMCFDIKAK
jgi:outer membrane protein assembly factor BamB